MTTTDRPVKPRWVWIRERDGGRVLAFQYVDPVAGPSAKGATVGEPPSPEDVYRLDEVVPGRYEIRAVALDAGHMTNGVEVVEAIEVAEGATVTRDFTLIAGAVVSIIVHLGSARYAHVHLVTGARSPRSASELRPLYHTPALRSVNSMSSKDCIMTTAFRDVDPGEYTVCVEPWDPGGRGPADPPVVSQRVVVGAADQTVELALPPPAAD